MAKVITLGETMVCFSPDSAAPLRYVSSFHPRIAGAESNLAVGLAKLGHEVLWISRLGEDEFGHYVQNMIRSEGVDTRAVRFDEANPTGIMFKETSRGETAVYSYRKHSAASAMEPEDLDESLFEEAEILHITGITPVLSESCRRTVERAVELAKRHGVRISFDPNIRRKLWGDRDYAPMLRDFCRESQILLMGLDEAKVLYGGESPEEIFAAVYGDGAGPAGRWTPSGRETLLTPRFWPGFWRAATFRPADVWALWPEPWPRRRTGTRKVTRTGESCSGFWRTARRFTVKT